jgi:hypothetical protein
VSFDSCVYGLTVRSNLPIPGVPECALTERPEVEVWLRLPCPSLKAATEETWFTSRFLDDSAEPTLTVFKLNGGAYFRLVYLDGTEFVIDRAGERVWASWPASLALEYTTPYLLGPIFGFVLRLRGAVCLHGSVVVVRDRAIALLGPGGAGKSTTAAAFARLGYPVLSDDIVALRNRDEMLLVAPGYPRLCLWPESVYALCGSREGLPRITMDWEKRYLDLTHEGYQFARRPLPLAAVHFLDQRSADPSAPYVEPVNRKAALMGMIANGYASALLDQSMRAREFEVLATVASAVPVRRVTPHVDPSKLSTLCSMILDDFETTTSSTQ